jgi:hypothetical protein
MDYALAKELKDAGYPQIRRDGFFLYAEQVPYAPRNAEKAYAPALHELLDACGERFYGLRRTDDGWEASDGEQAFIDPCKTADEAVARLWLALNKEPVDAR